MRKLLTSLLVLAIFLMGACLWWFGDRLAPNPETADTRPGSQGERPPKHLVGDVATRHDTDLGHATAARGNGRNELQPEPEWDPDAREWQVITVVDEAGRPVVGARIEPYAARSGSNRGTHYGWRGEESIGTSDARGRARIRFPVWIARRARTSAITFLVTHLRYPTQKGEVGVGTKEQVVVLKRGAFLTVSGWIDDPDDVITDVRPTASYYARLADEDWIHQAGRKPSTHKISAGRHSLYLHHKREETDYFSKVEIFTIEPGGVLDLHLKLVPAVRLVGKLDERVPRPVKNGAVMLNLGVVESPARMSREYAADIAADGTFVFPSLPPGEGEIIAICHGWVSAKVERESDPRLGYDAVSKTSQLSLQMVGFAEEAGPMTLKMERAATVVATILDDQDNPLPGAKLRLWPNVGWRHGMCHLFMRRMFEATSDANGRVTVVDLPPGSREGYRVIHERFWMPLRPRRAGMPARDGVLDLVSGESTQITVRLERRPPERR